MRLHLRVLSLLLVCSTFGLAGVVVHFDDLASGLVPSPYGGILWDNNWEVYDTFQPPYTPASAPNRIYGNYGKFAAGEFAEVPFFLQTPSVFEGAYLAGQPYSVYFNLYLGGSLVATSGSLMTSETPTFLSSGYSGLVDKVGVAGYVGYFVMDDVTYTDSAVPEPTTCFLVAGGVFGLLALRRRR